MVWSLSVASASRSEEVQCGNSQIEELLRSHSAQSCSPRLVMVAVRADTDLSLLAPSHVEVRRCGGSCGHYHHSCLPLHTRSLSVPSIVTEASAQEGVRETLCGDLEVEEHLRCGCGCQLTEQSCGSHQQFLPFECRCVCTNHQERDACLARGWSWDRSSCACTCPHRPYPTCPNNLMFDYLETCSCIPSHSRATLQTVSFFVLLVSLLLISVFAATRYFLLKKKKLRRNSKILHLHSPTVKDGDITELHSRELLDLLSET